MLNQTLNTQGQNYFRSGVLLVGNTDYANFRTSGVNDQVIIQSAIDEAFSSDIQEVRIITDFSVNVNPLYNENLGGVDRKICIKLRNNVKVTLVSGVTGFFCSGGNSSGTPAFIFGNHGNLENAQIVCEGNNAFDGQSTVSGTLGLRTGALSLDCRSSGCTILANNNFEISGKRTAGFLVQAYNSNIANVSIANNNSLNIFNCQSSHGALDMNQKGTGWTLRVSCQNSFSNAVVIANALKKSTLLLKYIKNCGEVKITTDTALGTDFNELDIEGIVENSKEHGISIAGFNGNLDVSVYNSQKSGVFFDTVSLLGVFYWSSKIIANIIANNNNQSGGLFAGISGIVRNFGVVFDTSDTQTIATQYRGINLTDIKNDYISLYGGKAKNNSNSQIEIYGVNSVVSPDVVGFNPVFDVITTKTITSAETIYILADGDILTLPKFSDLDVFLPKKYIVQCTSGNVEVKASQENDLSFKQINNFTAGSSFTLTTGQSATFIKLANKWQTVADTTSTVLNLTTLDAAGTIALNTSYALVDTSAGAYTKTIPLSTTILGKTIVLDKISRDFNLATFNLSGADKIEDYRTPALPVVATSFRMALPNEKVTLTAVAPNIFRLARSFNLEYMQAFAFRAGVVQNIAGPAGTTSVADLNSYRDGMRLVSSTVGFDAALNVFVAPVLGDYLVLYNFAFKTSNPVINLADSYIERSFSSAPTVFNIVDFASLGTIARPINLGPEEISSGSFIIRLSAGDCLRGQVRNQGSANLEMSFSTVDLARNVRPQRSFLDIKLMNPQY